jgi:hypothetical protein
VVGRTRSPTGASASRVSVGRNASVAAVTHWLVTLGPASASYIVNGDDCLTMNTKVKMSDRVPDAAALIKAAK